jgi:hypothetical protein
MRILIGILFLLSGYSALAASLTSIKTASPITIDGSLSESVWQQAGSTSFSNSAKSDNLVKVLSLWTDSYLYFAYDVKDTKLEAVNGGLYADDGAEIFIDTLYDRTLAMGADDYQFMANINGLVSNSSVVAKVVKSTVGYTMEIAIPWTLLKRTPSLNLKMGLLLANNDRDNGLSSQFDWAGLINSGSYSRPSLWGDLTLAPAPVAPPASVPSSLAAVKLSSAITLDGSLADAAWSQASSISFSNAAKSDNQVKVMASWTDAHLYIAYDVKDTKLEAVNGGLYADDGAEIFLDTLYNRTASMDADDYQFMANINGLVSNSSVVVKVVKSTIGYTMEIAIPWTLLKKTPAAGMKMGLLLGNNDRDNGLSSQFDNMGLINSGSYSRPNLWGDLVLNAAPTPVGQPSPVDQMTAFRAPASVNIDGNLSDSGWSSANYISFANSAKSDNSARVRAMWDSTNLYIAYTVNDAKFEAVNGALYLDDGVEVFVDTLYNRTTSMDADDRQFMANINSMVSNSAVKVKSLSFTGYYSVEMAIPWTYLNRSPSAGMKMGILLGNNDRDNGISSQYDHMGLINSGSYSRPNLWGTLTLGADPGAPIPAPAPAPVIDYADLSWNANSELDLRGYKIFYGTAPGNYSQSVDVGFTGSPSTPKYRISGLSRGVRYYFAVKAYNNIFEYSGYSNEAYKDIP